MDTAGLPSAEVCRRAGISYRQLDYWGRLGLVTIPPSTCGSGCPRRWPPETVERVCAIASLVRVGIRPSRAAAYVDAGTDLSKVIAAPVTRMATAG